MDDLSVQRQPKLHSGFQTSQGYLLRSYLKQQQKVWGGKLEIYIIETPKL